MSLYPATQKNPKLAANVVKMLDMSMGNELSEGLLNEFVPPSSDGGGENDRSRRIRKLLEEPKDNEGSGFTIGDIIEDLIYKTEEEQDGLATNKR